MSGYLPPTLAEMTLAEARQLIDAFENAPEGTGVLDGSGVEVRKRSGEWVRTDRANPMPMTTVQLVRQLCPDLAAGIDQIMKEAL